jgi:hypothetical protein
MPTMSDSPLTKKARAIAEKRDAARDGDFQIVSPAQDLAALASAIQLENEAARDHFDAAKDAALPHVLRIGLHCLVAREIFGRSDPADRGQGRKPKEITSRRDEISEVRPGPASFSAWLLGIPGLQKGAAYKYLQAIQGLGLTHESSPEEVAPALKKLRDEHRRRNLPKPTLALLMHKARQDEDEGDPPPSPEPTPEQRAGEARVQIDEFQSEWQMFLRTGYLDYLGPKDLRPLATFLADELDRVKKLIKSAS